MAFLTIPGHPSLMGLAGDLGLVLVGVSKDPEFHYPGDIQPGDYTRNEIVELLRKHKDNPEAIQFIADMLEE